MKGHRFLKIILSISFSILLIGLLTYLPCLSPQEVEAAPGDIQVCSSNLSGQSGNGDSSAASISGNGRFVAFSSAADNLVAGDTNGVTDIFRKDLQTGEVLLCSCDSSGQAGNGDSGSASISGDGRFVAFSSAADNLVAGDTNGVTDIFRKDLQTGEVLLCSCDSSGQAGNGFNGDPSITSDGEFIAFSSRATNFYPVTEDDLPAVFRKDLDTGGLSLCSCSPSGIIADGWRPLISDDGRYVAFNSTDTNLISRPWIWGTPMSDVCRKDLQTGEVLLCSPSQESFVTNRIRSISSDARYVAFYSDSASLVEGDDNNAYDIFRTDLVTGEVLLCSCDSSGYEGNDSSWSASLSEDGRFVAFSSHANNLAQGDADSYMDIFRKDLQTGEVSLCSSDTSGRSGGDSSNSPSISGDGKYVAFESYAEDLLPVDTSVKQVLRKEVAPPLPHTIYFAEGYTGPGFKQYLCMMNPLDFTVEARVTYLFPGGQSTQKEYAIPSRSRFTADVNAEVGEGKDVSMVIESPYVLFAERPMYFEYSGSDSPWTGGHATRGSRLASDSWYFAEGYTGPGFDEWICVLNPGAEPATLDFFFQTQEEGEKVVEGLSVPPCSRGTFKVDDLLGGSYQTALKIESDQPVVAERSMYFCYAGTGGWNWTGGHCVTGVVAPSHYYYFPEGTTRAGFEEWLCLQNPRSWEISVHATYHFNEGDDIEKDYPVPAGGRITLYIPQEVGAGRDVSVYLSTGHAHPTLAHDTSFLAERSMYFNYGGMEDRNWTGGHSSIGGTRSSEKWLFPEGYTGAGFEEWLCLMGFGFEPFKVTITYLPEGGAPIIREHTVTPNSRYTVMVNADAGTGLALSMEIDSEQPICCERAMYFNYNGRTGGHDVVGYSL